MATTHTTNVAGAAPPAGKPPLPPPNIPLPKLEAEAIPPPGLDRPLGGFDGNHSYDQRSGGGAAGGKAAASSAQYSPAQAGGGSDSAARFDRRPEVRVGISHPAFALDQRDRDFRAVRHRALYRCSDSHARWRSS